MKRRMKKPRSPLYREALAEYVARNEPDRVTEAMNEVCDEVGSIRRRRLSPDPGTDRMVMSDGLTAEEENRSSQAQVSLAKGGGVVLS